MTSSIHLSNSLSGMDKWWRDSAIGVFDTLNAAEQAVEELERTGFDMNMLSIVGKEDDSEEHPVAGALSSLGVPRESIDKYEADLKANNYLVVARGSPHEVENAQAILRQNAATATEIASSPKPNIANHVNIS
jgi:hypothetical protein